MTENPNSTVSPISQLPAEILAKVFVHTAEIDPIPAPTDGRPLSLAWIRTTHVCAFWRMVALGERKLWARSVGTLPRANATFLERAGNDAPLSFFFYRAKSLGEPPGRADLINRLRAPAHLRRTERIEWRSSAVMASKNEAALLDSILASSPFDALRHLCVSITSDYVWRRNSAQLYYANSLETVQLQGYFVSLIAPRLTSLTLGWLSDRVSGDELLTLLHNCPLLTFFEFAGFKSYQTPLESIELPVQLTHLRQLILRLSLDTTPEITNFVRHLSMPANAQVHLHKKVFRQPKDNMLFESLFEMTSFGNEDLAIEFSSHCIQFRAVSSSCARLSFSTNFFDLDTVIYIFNMAHDWKRVRALKACASKWFERKGSWERIFWALPAISLLEFNWSPRFEPESLGPIFTALGGRNALPELTKIVAGEDVRPEKLIVEDAVACLQARKAVGAHPLASFELLCHRRDEDIASKLAELVKGSVRWKDS